MRRNLFIVFAVLLLAIPGLEAEEIWAALICGTQEETATPIPKQLKPYEKALNRVFGYNSLRVIGESTRTLNPKEEIWIIPKDELYMRVLCRETAGKRHLLNLQLYQSNKLIVESDAKMAHGKPLLIRGPQWGCGQLIFLLAIQ